MAAIIVQAVIIREATTVGIVENVVLAQYILQGFQVTGV